MPPPSVAGSSTSTWEERAVAPPLPALEAMLCPPGETDLSCRQRQCSWLQALEGDIDTAHFVFLHAGKLEAADIDPDHMDRFQLVTRAARHDVRVTDWGTMYTAYRPAEPGSVYHRFAHFLMPFWAMFPNGPFADNIIAQAWVPMDDTHTMQFFLSWNRRTQPLTRTVAGAAIPDFERYSPTLPNTTDWFGRWRPAASAENDYLIDRELQRTTSFSGITGVFPQDSAVTESMGEISDRTLEPSGAERPHDRRHPPAPARGCRGPARQGHRPAARGQSRSLLECARRRARRPRRPALVRRLRGGARAGCAAGSAARGGVGARPPPSTHPPLARKGRHWGSPLSPKRRHGGGRGFLTERQPLRLKVGRGGALRRPVEPLARREHSIAVLHGPFA